MNEVTTRLIHEWLTTNSLGGTKYRVIKYVYNGDHLDQIAIEVETASGWDQLQKFNEWQIGYKAFDAFGGHIRALEAEIE